MTLDKRSNGDNTRRRRKCVACGFRFSTLEVAVPQGETYKLHLAKMTFIKLAKDEATK